MSTRNNNVQTYTSTHLYSIYSRKGYIDYKNHPEFTQYKLNDFKVVFENTDVVGAGHHDLSVQSTGQIDFSNIIRPYKIEGALVLTGTYVIKVPKLVDTNVVETFGQRIAGTIMCEDITEEYVEHSYNVSDEELDTLELKHNQRVRKTQQKVYVEHTRKKFKKLVVKYKRGYRDHGKHIRADNLINLIIHTNPCEPHAVFRLIINNMVSEWLQPNKLYTADELKNTNLLLGIANKHGIFKNFNLDISYIDLTSIHQVELAGGQMVYGDVMLTITTFNIYNEYNEPRISQ